jgi:uncharacterized protein DUF6266
MAVVKSGPLLGLSGTIDGITYSPQPNGTTVAKRKNTPSTIPSTVAQTSNNDDTGIFSKAMKHLKEVYDFGYAQECKIWKLNTWNTMVKCNRKIAMQGTYPNRYLDFSRVLMTKGELPSALELSVKRVKKGLAFQWNTAEIPKRSHHTDHVIMLAYFPELEEARYILSGAKRSAGKDHLPLEGIKKGYKAHVYIAFATDDHKEISNSTYLGQFNW